MINAMAPSSNIWPTVKVPSSSSTPMKNDLSTMSLGAILSGAESVEVRPSIITSHGDSLEITGQKLVPIKRKPCSKKSTKLRPYQCEKWQERFQDLLEFKEEYGHCLVPHDNQDNPQLARWVKRQRYQFNMRKQGKSASITDERIKILNSHGFVWDSHEAAWEERIRQLKDFVKKHGTGSVPARYPQNPQLATWAKCQRRQYKLHNEGKPCNISVERILALDSLGFEWELRTTKAQLKAQDTPGQLRTTKAPGMMEHFMSSNVESDYDLMMDVLSILSGDGSEPTQPSEEGPQIQGMDLQFLCASDANIIADILNSDDDLFDDDLLGFASD